MRKFLVILILVMTPVLIWRFTARSSGQSEPPKVEAPPPPVDTTALDSTINQIISANSHLDIGVAITDLQRNTSYQYGVTEPFMAASVAKLLTATLILHKVETNQLKPHQHIGGAPINGQLEKLVVESDNTAWQTFNTYLGTTELTQYARQIGLNSYNREANTMTTSDVAKLLSQLYQEKLLNHDHTQQLLSYLKKADSDQYIQAAVPDHLTSYHKAGYLNDRLHDTAIITDGDRAFVLVIFTKGTNPYNFINGTNIIHRITTFLP